MTTSAHTSSTTPGGTPATAAPARRGSRVLGTDGALDAYRLLRTVFTVAPILFGIDKFAEVLTDHWEKYLAPRVNDLVPGDAHDAMLMIGVIEILAGLLVAFAPKWGAVVVALWLAGIIVNLLILGDFYDVALRDFGLLVGALALARLAASPVAR
jgi:hypothetical protein